MMLIGFETLHRIEDGEPDYWALSAVDHAFRMYKNCHERNPRRNHCRPPPQDT